MATYKIIGPLRVCEHQPGETLADEDLAIEGVSVAHLIGSGHLQQTSNKRSESIAVQNQEDQP